MSIVEMIAICLLVYLLGGVAATVATAYVSAVRGNNWFSANYKSKRWTEESSAMIPPLAVFLGWPIAAPVALLCFTWNGFAKVTEFLADKARAIGERQELLLRGGKK